jgi:ABC-type nitrate/sulfonate/bicarbonate transport system substrate-binding protein
MKVLIRTGDYIQRAGGTLWARKAYIDQNPDVGPKLTRAIAKAVMFYRTDRAGSIPILREHLGLGNDNDAGVVWDETHNTFGAELPPDLFREIFESRMQDMIAAKQWPMDKPLPDPEQFLLRAQLDSTLKAMNYVPTKLAKPTN